MTKEVLIYKLTAYLFNKAAGINDADKVTQKKWISIVQHYEDSKWLDKSYNKWYPDKLENGRVNLSTLWDDIRKADLASVISILSDIDEASWALEEDIQEKALIYFINEFVRENPVAFKISLTFSPN
jgi:hypothetical protein